MITNLCELAAKSAHFKATAHMLKQINKVLHLSCAQSHLSSTQRSGTLLSSSAVWQAVTDSLQGKDMTYDKCYGRHY